MTCFYADSDIRIIDEKFASSFQLLLISQRVAFSELIETF